MSTMNQAWEQALGIYKMMLMAPELPCWGQFSECVCWVVLLYPAWTTPSSWDALPIFFTWLTFIFTFRKPFITVVPSLCFQWINYAHYLPMCVFACMYMFVCVCTCVGVNVCACDLFEFCFVFFTSVDPWIQVQCFQKISTYHKVWFQ